MITLYCSPSMSEPEACSPAVEEHSCCSELPAVAVVELRPRTTAAWQHVQGLAQNPRVRYNVYMWVGDYSRAM